MKENEENLSPGTHPEEWTEEDLQTASKEEGSEYGLEGQPGVSLWGQALSGSCLCILCTLY